MTPTTFFLSLFPFKSRPDPRTWTLALTVHTPALPGPVYLVSSVYLSLWPPQVSGLPLSSLYPIARLSLRRKAPFCLGNCQPVFIVNGRFPSQLLSSVDAPVDSPDGRCNCGVVSIVLVSQNLENKKQLRDPVSTTPDSQRTLGAFSSSPTARARCIPFSADFPRGTKRRLPCPVLSYTHKREQDRRQMRNWGLLPRGQTSLDRVPSTTLQHILY